MDTKESPWQLSEVFASSILGLCCLILCIRLPALPQLAGLCAAHLCGLAIYLALLWFLRRQGEQRWAIALRAFVTIVGVIGSLYYSLARVAFEAVPWKADAWLASIDTWLCLGHSPSLFVERFASPGLVEFFSFAYGVFLPYVYVTLFLNSLGRPLKENRRFVDGLTFIFAVGHFFYLALPSEGPVSYLSKSYLSPLEGGFFCRQMFQGVAMSGGNHGAFPSLHVAVSLYLCFFDLRHNRLRGIMFFPLILWIAFATLLLRWHYLIDIIAGSLLALVALRIFSARGGPSYRLLFRWPEANPDPELKIFAAAAEFLVCGKSGPFALGLDQEPEIKELENDLLRSRHRLSFKKNWPKIRAFLRRLNSLKLGPADPFLPMQTRRAIFFLLRELEILVIGLLPAIWVRVSLLPLGTKFALSQRSSRIAMVIFEALVVAWGTTVWTGFLYGIFFGYCSWFYPFFEERVRQAWQRARAFWRLRNDPDLRKALIAESKYLLSLGLKIAQVDGSGNAPHSPRSRRS